MGMMRRAPGMPCPPRTGFTLIELLVVISIIAVLAAITLGATSRLLGVQQEANIQTLIRKVDSEFQKQWRAVLDQANQDPIPDFVVAWAGGDADRARVIQRYIYLRNEFPTTYAEALTPIKIPLTVADVQASGVPPAAIPFYSYTAPPPPPNGKDPRYQLLALPQFNTPSGPMALSLRTQALYKWLLTSNTAIKPSATPGSAESSAVLLLSLIKPRRGAGTAFNPDETLGLGAIRDTNGDKVNEIVDANGVPLGFWRFPQGNPDFVNRPLSVLDPQGKLVDPAWNNKNTLFNVTAVYLFEDVTGLLIHGEIGGLPRDPASPIQVPPARVRWTPATNYYTLPVIGSAGKDGALGGVDLKTMQTPQNPQVGDNVYNYNLP